MYSVFLAAIRVIHEQRGPVTLVYSSDPLRINHVLAHSHFTVERSRSAYFSMHISAGGLGHRRAPAGIGAHPRSCPMAVQGVAQVSAEAAQEHPVLLVALVIFPKTYQGNLMGVKWRSISSVR